MVGFFRLSLILDKMQKCVYSSPQENQSKVKENPMQFTKYQAYYHILVKELENTKEEAKHLRAPVKRTNS